ncbi:hypothetical protein BBJ28_00001517 [Nothophytophthora sp. Chile5]|nr:hypothetical protein BBJ28_00001517 [Nothophytophthora sp. Chile5]
MPSSHRAWMEAEAKADETATAARRGSASVAADGEEHGSMEMLGVDDAASASKSGASASSTSRDEHDAQIEAADGASGTALFDLSSYTGGAPLLTMSDSSGASNVGGNASGTAEDAASTSHGMFGQVLDTVDSSHELIGKTAEGDEKKMGRPSHPAWQYFVRGEKRNQFHHHAYCKFCAENGVDPVAVRGVSGNMIRHLQKCIYCPTEIVTQLKLLCAQKDAASFNKKHQSHNRNVDILLHETSPVPKKKSRRSEAQGVGTVAMSPQTPDLRAQTTRGNSGVQDTTAVEDFMPLQLPLLTAEMSTGIANLSPAPSKPSAKSRFRDGAKRNGKSKAAQAHPHALKGDQIHQNTNRNDISQADLNKLVASATLSLGLPWDWTWTEQSARVFGDLHAKLETPSLELLLSTGAPSRDKQLSKMKDEQVGVTLAVSWWAAKYPRSAFVLLSLVNAIGEASAWELIDMGIEESVPGVLAEKIENSLTNLQDKGIHVINIVADTTFAYTAARLAVSSSSWTSLAIPVLPCFAHLLQVLLGVALTVSDRSMETMGEVIELLQMFSKHRVLKVLRRECGDPDAVLHLPSQDNWYSFIEAVDSVRQYEEMIKIVASKVVHASSDSGDLAGSVRSRTRTANFRKDSAGNTVDELAECGLSAPVIETIQTPEFWENVVALSELMSPLKEAHKMMGSNLASTCSLSEVFYQLGRMQQQYGIILSDWEDNTCGGRSIEQVRFLHRTVNNMWKLYDQPLMVLSYMFNYNLQHPFLARHQPSLQWLSIGKYAKQYFRGWFCAASSTRNPSRSLALSDEAAAQFMEDILAFKERKYPFDSDSMCDFENPKLFYMLVSDSHPLMHMFGSRLFSLVTRTPALGDVLPGKCFIPSKASTMCPQDALLPLLQKKLFAQTAMRPSKDMLKFVQNGRSKSNCASSVCSDAHFLPDSILETDQAHSAFLQSFNPAGKPKLEGSDDRSPTLANVWNKMQWTALAKEWKAHWEKETDTSDLPQSPKLLDAFTPGLTLDQIFKEKLPSRLPHVREDAVVDV